MLIKKKGRTKVVCDGCGRNHPKSDIFVAMEDDWITLVKHLSVDINYHYCPNCYKLGDNGELFVKVK